MNDNTTILNLLNKFSNDHKNISWKMKCSYSDGMGITINEIKIIAQPGNRSIGFFSYQVETGKVHFCTYKSLKKTNLSSGEAGSENVVDLLLDMINYSKGQKID